MNGALALSDRLRARVRDLLAERNGLSTEGEEREAGSGDSDSGLEGCVVELCHRILLAEVLYLRRCGYGLCRKVEGEFDVDVVKREGRSVREARVDDRWVDAGDFTVDRAVVENGSSTL